MDYEKDVTIDETALDVEWLEQPRLTLKYSRLAAEAEAEYNRARERLEVVKAELDKDIRTNPDKYDIGKVTEVVVANTILLQDEYQAAKQNVIDAKHDWDMAKAAVFALQDKKKALENLVQLHGMQYFAGPTVPRDLSKEWEQRKKQEKADKTVRIRRGKK